MHFHSGRVWLRYLNGKDPRKNWGSLILVGVIRRDAWESSPFELVQGPAETTHPVDLVMLQ